MAKGRRTVGKPQVKGPSSAVRMAVDGALTCVLIAVMSTALVTEAPHEFLGLALLALMVAHLVLNRRWFAALGKGRWSAPRVLQTAAVAGVVLCALGQAVSALILSEHALAFLPEIPGSWWARKVHMLCSSWFFVLAFAHVGLQWRGMVARIRPLRQAKPALLWVLRAIWAAVAIFGVVSFLQLGLGPYLLGQVEFAFADYDTPVVLIGLRYLCVGVLITGVGHYVGSVLRRRRQT